MPRAQFVRADRGLVITRTMPTPRSLSDINAWLKTARKFIPDLANLLDGAEGWYVFRHSATLQYVTFELRNAIDEKANLVIDRTVKFGA